MGHLAKKNNKIPRELELCRHMPPPYQQDVSTRRFWHAFMDAVAKGRRRRKGKVDDFHGWLIVVKKSGQQRGVVFDDVEKQQAESETGDSLGSRINDMDLEVKPKPLRCAEAVSVACHVKGGKTSQPSSTAESSMDLGFT